VRVLEPRINDTTAGAPAPAGTKDERSGTT
jgi:hypothetical protein